MSERLRFMCHYCDWERRVHVSLPFDFQFARLAHRRHMRRQHSMRPVMHALGGVTWLRTHEIAPVARG